MFAEIAQGLSSIAISFSSELCGLFFRPTHNKLGLFCCTSHHLLGTLLGYAQQVILIKRTFSLFACTRDDRISIRLSLSKNVLFVLDNTLGLLNLRRNEFTHLLKNGEQFTFLQNHLIDEWYTLPVGNEVFQAID